MENGANPCPAQRTRPEIGDPIDREKSPFRQYQYGAVLGGPVKKERAFFFSSFDIMTLAFLSG